MTAPPPGPRALLRALECVVRLPLLGDRELGRLLDVTEREALSLRRELERLGWVEWVMPDSAQIQARRRSFLRPEALPDLAALLGRPREELAARVAVRRSEALAGIAAMEAAVGVNALVVGLVGDSGARGVSLADARRLPWNRRGQPRIGAAGPRAFWYPSGVAAYGCLRSAASVAPFFVAWDRAGAPAWYRRELLRRWVRFRLAENPWGPAALPPVVVAAASEATLDQWSDACRRLEFRGDRLELVLATVRELTSSGPGAAIWRTPSAPGRALLARLLDWRPGGSLPAASLPPAWSGRVEALPRREGAASPPLRSRARLLRRRRLNEHSRGERVALVSLATDAEEKRLLEYLGRNPLLDEEQLSALLELPPEATRRRLERLRELGVVAPMSRAAEGEEEPARRFLLAAPGLRWLAARDRVPFTPYARYGAAIALSGSSGMRLTRPARAYHHFDHAVGVNRALVRFAVDARATGGTAPGLVSGGGRGAAVRAPGRPGRPHLPGRRRRAGARLRDLLLPPRVRPRHDGGHPLPGEARELPALLRAGAMARGLPEQAAAPLRLCPLPGRGDGDARGGAVEPGPGAAARARVGLPERPNGGILGPVWRTNTGPHLTRTLFEWNAVAGRRSATGLTAARFQRSERGRVAHRCGRTRPCLRLACRITE